MHTARLVILIALLSMFVPLSMDLYLPALPKMIEDFGATELQVNSTLYLFYFFMSIGMIFLTPLSDKYGRKKILIPSAITFCIASLCCFAATNIVFLVTFRSIQALGVGAMLSLSTAIIKDCFEGSQREKILGITQALQLTAPMIAPVLGAIILQFLSWRYDFIVLAIFGLIVIFLALFQKETLPKSEQKITAQSNTFKTLFELASNKSFLALLLFTSIAPMGYMAFISSSSYIYQVQFNLSELTFSIIYAFNAFITIIASLLYIKLRSALSAKRLMSLVFIFIQISGVLVLSIGYIHPILCMICFLPNAYFCTTLKPLSTSLLLCQSSNAGAASSLINFSQTIFSFLGLVLGSLPWQNTVSGLGLIMTISCLISTIGWVYILKSKNIVIAAFEEEKNIRG